MFAILKPLPRAWRLPLWLLSFLLPLAVWSAVSYLPVLWHPLMKITDAGGSAWLKPGILLEREAFAKENATLVEKGLAPARGERANPVFFPPPHAVFRALYTAFQTKPVLRGDVWLHESLWSSIQTIFWGFVISSAVAIPLGILCGAYAAWSRLSEPVVDFMRYMPAPAFGALCVAILGINGAPKIAIIVIGTFFQQVLVVANTIRRTDPTLVEAAQTLGAKGRKLILTVIIPARLPDLYTDTRILIGCAWTYLLVAEVVGVSSGITFFINQQAKYRNFENVYAAIILIGLIGLATDQFLGALGRRLFPWEGHTQSRLRPWLRRLFGRPAAVLPAPSEH